MKASPCEDRGGTSGTGREPWEGKRGGKEGPGDKTAGPGAGATKQSSPRRAGGPDFLTVPPARTHGPGASWGRRGGRSADGRGGSRGAFPQPPHCLSK